MSGKERMQGGVEVWTARPDRLGCDVCAQLATVLDDEERGRAGRLRCEEDRRAFVVAHAMRRIALGLALAMDPHDVRFGVGPHGEPVLQDGPQDAPCFSLSRSRGLVAVAIAHGGAVGIDVEAVRDGVDGALLQPYMAAGDEPLDGDVAFYVQWTALEAYWKARGLGLSASHPRIRLAPVGEDCWEVQFADDGESAGMNVMRLPCEDTHVLALACGNGEASIRLVDLDGLAQAPQPIGEEPLSSCKERHCGVAQAPNIFNA